MAEDITHGPVFIERETFTTGTTLARHCIHLTGGQTALDVAGGWSLGPVKGGLERLAPLTLKLLQSLTYQAGLRAIGRDETSDFDTPLPTRIWTPLYGQTEGRMPAADEWGSVGVAAQRGGDPKLADLATAISTSLRAADIRLRDASDSYRNQLVAALVRGQEPGLWFRNIPLQDLYLAFHSLLSEMASARDYIATFAGHLVDAPSKIDALSRLREWITTPSRADKAKHPLVAALLAGLNEESDDAWLLNLTEHRNLFLHRQPLGTGNLRQGLVLVERRVGGIVIPILELPIPALMKTDATSDALVRFVGLHERLITLAANAISFAKYSAAPPHLIVRE